MVRLRRLEESGFTLIELSVIILILAVLAATVVPRLLAYQSGSEVRSFVLKLPAFAETARQSAISSGQTLQLTYSESDRRFGIQGNNEEESSRLVELPDSIDVETSRTGAEESAGGDWSIRFFSDGSCEGGAIEFDFDGGERSLLFDAKSGRANWSDGQLPEAENLKWKAGEIEIRTQGGPNR